MSPLDYADLQALAQMTRVVFERVGINVDYISMDWARWSSAAQARRRWTRAAGFARPTRACLSPTRPATCRCAGNGSEGWFGWPTSPREETLRDDWFDAPDLAAQQKICAEMQQIAWEEVPFIPVGQRFSPTAVRTTMSFRPRFRFSGTCEGRNRGRRDAAAS